MSKIKIYNFLFSIRDKIGREHPDRIDSVKGRSMTWATKKFLKRMKKAFGQEPHKMTVTTEENYV